MMEHDHGLRGYLTDALKGHEVLVDRALIALLSGGHLLIEGPPGVGKTTLAQALAMSFGGSFRRIQMTSDLLPSDITGALRPDANGKELKFHPGPIFAQVVLADELNRSSSKTQSALLEAMAESQVTVDGVSHLLPSPFFVVATQNPQDFQGVYPLTESQLDRFILHISLSPPEQEAEIDVYRSFLKGEARKSLKGSVIDVAKLKQMQKSAAEVFVEESLLKYCRNLAESTRHDPRIRVGASVRAVLDLIAAARASAYLKGRKHVIPEDLANLVYSVWAHRISFFELDLGMAARTTILEELFSAVVAPQ